jgi:hypothetical protein
MDEATMTRRAREAIARGDWQTARQLLAQVLRERPNSEMAWMMMSTVVDQADQKRDCLERVLRINPGNDAARERLAALDAADAVPAPPPEAASQRESTPPPEAEPEATPTPTGEAQPTDTAGPEPAASEVASSDATPSPAPVVPAEAERSAPPPAPFEAVSEAVPAVPAATVPQDTAAESAPAVPPPEAMDELPSPEPVPEIEAALHPLTPSEPASGEEEAGTGELSSFVAEGLAAGEQVLHRTTLTPWVFSRPVAVVLGAVIVLSLPTGDLQQSIVLVCGGGLLVLALAYFGLRAIRYFGSEYVVTDRRVLAKRGLLARQTVDMPLLEIDEVRVGRSLFGGSSGPGNVWIRRTDGTQTMFWRIRQPGAFRDAVERGRAVLGDSVGS